MRYQIRHGAHIDVPTVDEIRQAVGGVKGHPEDVQTIPVRTTIRAMENLGLDTTGSGIVEVYTVPPGYEFFLRRVSLNISTCTDGTTGAVQLGTAGVYVLYLRSGNYIEYAMPIGPTTHVQVPGVESWSDVEGPYLSNGEKLQVQAAGLTAGADVLIEATGVLLKPTARAR